MMRYCAIILMSSLPAVWITVGVLLLLLAVVMTILFFLKSREVATLKKQCEDLRDTMRMMRYEEANLARMLHTANKPMQQEPVEFVAEEAEEKDEDALQTATLVAAEAVAEEAVVEETVESITITEEVSEELKPEGLLAATNEEEDLIAVSEQEVIGAPDNSPMLEVSEGQDSMFSETLEETTVVEDIQPSVAQSHKQPINERRPAIPNDLFSAWFAENEETPEEEPAALLEAVEEPIAESAIVEEPVEETFVSQENVSELAVEESQETKPVQEMELSKDDERFFRKLERIVNTRLRNPNLNIDIIAAQFGIGRTNFYRKVREVTGMSPNDYLRKCRMERAAELLNNSEVAVSEVCVQVGIPDAQYFSRVFKMFYGVSPSVYRENNNQ